MTEHEVERPAGSLILMGDAELLIETVRDAARQAGVATTVVAGDGSEVAQPGEPLPTSVVLLALRSDGKRSFLVRAGLMLARLSDRLDGDLPRIAIIESGLTRFRAPRVQRLLATEVLAQVELAAPGAIPGAKTRTLARRMGSATLAAAGLRVIRLHAGV